MRYVKVERRINEIVNRLNKTKEERSINFEEEKAARLADEKRRRKEEVERKKAEEERQRKAKTAQNELLSYGSVFKNADMHSNRESAEKVRDYREYEDNFL